VSETSSSSPCRRSRRELHKIVPKGWVPIEVVTQLRQRRSRPGFAVITRHHLKFDQTDWAAAGSPPRLTAFYRTFDLILVPCTDGLAVQETAKACSITTGDACPWIEHTTCGTYPLILDLLAGIHVIVLQNCLCRRIDASFPRLWQEVVDTDAPRLNGNPRP